MIEHNVKTIEVDVLMPLPSGVLELSNFIGDSTCELVPYINDISGERDPMVRLIINNARFLHLSTIKKSHPRVVFRNKEGRDFEAKDVIDKLYN